MIAGLVGAAVAFGLCLYVAALYVIFSRLVDRRNRQRAERAHRFLYGPWPAPKRATELPRAHDLAPRRWQLPTGEIVFDTVNPEAIELLKADPDEYFRRTRRASC